MKTEGELEGWKTGRIGFTTFPTRRRGGREQLCRSKPNTVHLAVGGTGFQPVLHGQDARATLKKQLK
jgi:hypothetical protein